LGSPAGTLSCCLWSATGHELDDHNDYRDYQDNVNQTSRDMERESKKPED
jgi:hypothetical protein